MWYRFYLTTSRLEEEQIEEQIGALKKFLNSVPEKALNLGLRVLLAVIVFFIGRQLIKLICNLLKKALQRANVEVGAVQFLNSLLRAALYVVLVFMIATEFGMDAASVVALLGSAGVAIGLAIQGSLSNLAGGVLILMLKPFKVGDYIIDSTGKEGVVTEIQIFYTRLLTVDNKSVILPNGQLANNSVINVTAMDCRRLDLVIGISYTSDLKLAKETLMKVLIDDTATMKDKELLVYVDALDSSSVNLGIRFWVRQADYWTAKFRITENCKLALDAAGIEIPFTQVDVHLDSK
ncbi:MAG: mechanosensitive ion channel family protein [Acetatifactor sp.]